MGPTSTAANRDSEMRDEIGLRPTLTENCIQSRTLLERARARLKHALELCQPAKTRGPDLSASRAGGRLTDFQPVNRVRFRVRFRALQAGGTALRWSLCCAGALTHPRPHLAMAQPPARGMSPTRPAISGKFSVEPNSGTNSFVVGPASLDQAFLAAGHCLAGIPATFLQQLSSCFAPGLAARPHWCSGRRI